MIALIPWIRRGMAFVAAADEFRELLERFGLISSPPDSLDELSDVVTDAFQYAPAIYLEKSGLPLLSDARRLAVGYFLSQEMIVFVAVSDFRCIDSFVHRPQLDRGIWPKRGDHAARAIQNVITSRNEDEIRFSFATNQTGLQVYKTETLVDLLTSLSALPSVETGFIDYLPDSLKYIYRLLASVPLGTVLGLFAIIHGSSVYLVDGRNLDALRMLTLIDTPEFKTGSGIRELVDLTSLHLRS